LTARQTAVRGVVATPSAAWRVALRRHLAWLLLLKFAALVLLWALFFSPAHRVRVDAGVIGEHLTATPQEGTRD
jgi:hypothetical protein